MEEVSCNKSNVVLKLGSSHVAQEESFSKLEESSAKRLDTASCRKKANGGEDSEDQTKHYFGNRKVI